VRQVRASHYEPGNAGYPRRLTALGARRPSLHVQGTITDPPLAVAVVGARAASADELRTSHALAAHVATAGGVVVSGGALGVDAAAHRGALEAGGATVVVVGTGLDIIYPDRHRGLFEAVVDRGGALVSMFPAGTPPRAGNFVRRNRVIAALADLIVVVSASARSGSLHTARAAAELGRRVAAVPGSPGTQALIAAGAAVVETGADLDLALAGTPRRPARRALRPDEQRVWDALDPAQPRDAGDVAAAAGVRLATALVLLSDLEAAGWIVPVAGAAYLRSPAPAP